MPYRTNAKQVDVPESPSKWRRFKCWLGSHEWSIDLHESKLIQRKDCERLLASFADAKVYCPHCGQVIKSPGTHKLAGPEAEYPVTLEKVFEIQRGWNSYRDENNLADWEHYVDRKKNAKRDNKPRMYFQVYD